MKPLDKEAERTLLVLLFGVFVLFVLANATGLPPGLNP